MGRKTCALLRAKTSALLRRKTCAVLRARTCALFTANTITPSQIFPRGLPELPQRPPDHPGADTNVLSLRLPPKLSPDVFSTFWGTSHAKPSVLRRFLEGNCLKMVSKPSISHETSLKKSKKHNARATSGSFLLACATNLNDFGTQPLEPLEPRNRFHGPLLRPSLPHAPGVRMTVVKTNSLKKNELRARDCMSMNCPTCLTEDL